MTSPNSATTTRTKACFKAAILESMGTIHLTKAFTVVEAIVFKRSCQDAFEQNPALKEIVLDFADTEFIDSSGIGALVICHRLCKSKSAQLRLVNVPPQVMMALSLTELDKVFLIEQAAIATPDDLTIKNADGDNPSESIPTIHPSVRSKAKRALDIAGAVVGLVLTAILVVIVGIIIKLDDGGPIFFSQTRCSFMGKRFKIWKFRSMVLD
ncbi:MAG: sugar transferase, partial [Phormidesmis sp.]